MKNTDIYVEIRTWDFWWGIYGLTDQSTWEDIDLYRKMGNAFEQVEGFCLCTRDYFLETLDKYTEDPDEVEAVAKINQFLTQQQPTFWYAYSNPKSNHVYEVPFEADRNEAGLKPSYIELWHPAARMDIAVVESSVKLFCAKFLGITVEHIYFIGQPAFDEAKAAYLEWPEVDGIAVTRQLIKQTADEMGKSEDEMIAYLKVQLGEFEIVEPIEDVLTDEVDQQ